MSKFKISALHSGTLLLQLVLPVSLFQTQASLNNKTFLFISHFLELCVFSYNMEGFPWVPVAAAYGDIHEKVSCYAANAGGASALCNICHSMIICVKINTPWTVRQLGTEFHLLSSICGKVPSICHC